MGKTPKHQGRKMSRPYNAKTVHVSKSISGNQRLTRSGRKFLSAEYISRKLSSKYGSQHLRLQNQSYLFGVARGQRKSPYFTQSHKSNKKRHLQSRELQRQTMQEPGAEQSTSKTNSNTENETNTNDSSEESLANNKYILEDITECSNANGKSQETQEQTVVEEETQIKDSSEDSVVECVYESVDSQTSVNSQDSKNNGLLAEVESETNDEIPEEIGVEDNHNNSCERVAVEEGTSGDSGYDKTTNLDDRLSASEDCPTSCASTLVTQMSEENFVSIETETVNYDLKIHDSDDSESLGDKEEAVTCFEYQTADVQFQKVAETVKRELEDSDVRTILKSPLLSLGSNIRATSGRRPVHKCVVSDKKATYNNDASTENIHNSRSGMTNDDELILNEPFMENVSYRSKKRAAPSDAEVEPKKQKVMDITERSGLLSVISSPIQLFKCKIKTSQENHSSVSEDITEDEHIIKKSSKELEGNSREKVITSSVGKTPTPMYKNWCSVM